MKNPSLSWQDFENWRKEVRQTYASQTVRLNDVDIGRRLKLSCDLFGNIYVNYGNEQYYCGDSIAEAIFTYDRVANLNREK